MLHHPPLATVKRSRTAPRAAPAKPDFSVKRLLNQCDLMSQRRDRIMAIPLEHIGNEQFCAAMSRTVEVEILNSPPDVTAPIKQLRASGDLPAYLESLYDVPLLTREQESHLFRRMNYLKYKAGVLRADLIVSPPEMVSMDRIEELYQESVVTRNQIIRANLRLVVSISKRHWNRSVDFFELVSDGNVSLISAVEKFDFSRGNRFSTYASWAIIMNFSRTLPSEYRHRDRFRTSCPELFGNIEDVRPDISNHELRQTRMESLVDRLLGHLDERERQIITGRFGLKQDQNPLKLRQLGEVMGVTKERVRQIQCRAMVKLRKAADEDLGDESL